MKTLKKQNQYIDGLNMRASLLVLCLNLALWRSSEAYQIDCQSMIPSDSRYSGGYIQPQNANGGAVPFTVTLNAATYHPGDTVQVTVEGQQQLFSGFLIEARRADSSLNTVEPIGTFTVFSGSQATCYNQASGSYGLTHTGAGQLDMKSAKTFVWKAPANSEGNIKFRLTLIETKERFWTNIESGVLMVAGAFPAYNTGMVPIRQINTVNECGSVKGCFLLPGGCVESDCEFLLTYRGNGDLVDFEMSAKTNGYVAVGFSDDNRMGSDSVIECLYDSRINQVIIRHTYNQGHNNIEVTKPYAGLSNQTGYYNNGRLSCRFTRQRFVIDAPNVYNLDKKYYLIMARGAADQGAKLPHDLSFGHSMSPDEVDIAATSSYTGSRRYSIAKAHGCMMTIAWVFCASFGMLLARYYKPMWASQRLCSERIWFSVHRGLMLTCMTLTILAIVLIFLMVGGYSYGLKTLPYAAHPILGLIVMCLAIINPLISLCRCHPSDENRPIFNWIHWAVGTIAHVLSVPCMFIGLSLPKAGAPPAAAWVLIVYVIVHCACEIILEIHQCCTNKRNKEKNEDFLMQRTNHPHVAIREPEPSGRFFKITILSIHGVLVGACTIAIVLLIAIY